LSAAFSEVDGGLPVVGDQAAQSLVIGFAQHAQGAAIAEFDRLPEMFQRHLGSPPILAEFFAALAVCERGGVAQRELGRLQV